MATNDNRSTPSALQRDEERAARLVSLDFAWGVGVRIVIYPILAGCLAFLAESTKEVICGYSLPAGEAQVNEFLDVLRLMKFDGGVLSAILLGILALSSVLALSISIDATGERSRILYTRLENEQIATHFIVIGEAVAFIALTLACIQFVDITPDTIKFAVLKTALALVTVALASNTKRRSDAVIRSMRVKAEAYLEIATERRALFILQGFRVPESTGSRPRRFFRHPATRTVALGALLTLPLTVASLTLLALSGHADVFASIGAYFLFGAYQVPAVLAVFLLTSSVWADVSKRFKPSLSTRLGILGLVALLIATCFLDLGGVPLPQAIVIVSLVFGAPVLPLLLVWHCQPLKGEAVASRKRVRFARAVLRPFWQVVDGRVGRAQERAHFTIRVTNPS